VARSESSSGEFVFRIWAAAKKVALTTTGRRE
jgi:hypothetical protein